MKTLILAVAALGIGIATARAGDGGDLPMPPPAASRVAPSTTPAPKAGGPVLHTFATKHDTTIESFPPNPVGGGARD